MGSTPTKWILAENLPKSRQNDWSAFTKWLRGAFAAAPKPVAALTYDESDGARLLNAALELDISVPEELAILTIGDNKTICENQSAPLSSIDQNLERGYFSDEATSMRMNPLSPTGFATRHVLFPLSDRAGLSILTSSELAIP